METLSQIEKYLSGEMPEAEKTAFEAAIQQDDAMQQEVALVKDIIAGIEQAGADDFAAKLQAWEQEIQAADKPQEAKVRRLFSPTLSLALAAAIVLILTFTFIFNPFTSPADPFQVAFQPYQDEITVMGGGNTAFDQQKANEAMALYMQEKYAEALPLLKELADSNPDMAVFGLYEGISAMQAGASTEAQAAFQALEHTSYAAQGAWYSILAQIKAGNYDVQAIKPALSRIAETEGHPYQKQAAKLLKNLHQ